MIDPSNNCHNTPFSLCLKIRACVYNNDVCVSIIRTSQITVRYVYFFFSLKMLQLGNDN